MTVDKIIKIEKNLTDNLSQKEIDDIETKKLQKIKSYANQYLHTDVMPYEVIKIISPICVEIRAMNAIQIEFPQNFHEGGFVGHFADNRQGQKYEYSTNLNAKIIRIRWSQAKRQWQSKDGNRFIMSDKPYKFYDYNF